MAETIEHTDKYRKTDGILYNYRSIKAEIKNLELDIEELKADYEGCGAINYSEKSSPTYAFNSSVENEVVLKEKRIKRLTREKESKERLIQKVDNALETLEEKESQIIKLRYFQHKGWGYIGSVLNLEENYCRNFKRDIIKHLSKLIFISECSE